MIFHLTGGWLGGVFDVEAPMADTPGLRIFRGLSTGTGDLVRSSYTEKGSMLRPVTTPKGDMLR